MWGRPPPSRSAERTSPGNESVGSFALWKDADPDIPILKEAKAEYSKLQ
jgi:hypothetical protein